MSNLNAREQLMLELVNRARMDPAAEAKRFGIGLNSGSPNPLLTAASKEVYAGNDHLNLAAQRHSLWMLATDDFTHFAVGGGNSGFSPADRIDNTPYGVRWTAAENISAQFTTTAANAAFLNASILSQHEGLFRSAGHRANILDETLGHREIGIDQSAGQFFTQGRLWNTSMITQVFALGDQNTVFVTGVVYSDNKIVDNFYSIGEAVAAGFAVGGGGGDNTGSGGGYEIGFAEGSGAQTITFGAVQAALSIGTRNIKLDFVNGSEVWTDTSLSITGGVVTEIHAYGRLGIDLTGTGANEKLFGNSGANTLMALGGIDTLDGGGGGDTMFGGDDSDTYVVDNIGDVVDESGSTGGADTIRSSIAFDLRSAAVIGDVERLTLTGATAGFARGNNLDNLIIGSTAANSLAGFDGMDILRGGLGNDVLNGGNDADTFVFNTALNATTNRDTIQAFNPAEDVIHLENAIFTKLGAPRNLPAGFLKKGVNATDANDFIVYNPANGQLSHDKDGNGAGLKVLFATLSGAPNITAADFVII
jgi:Ca2+-binding RTX toxin-like protein